MSRNGFLAPLLMAIVLLSLPPVQADEFYYYARGQRVDMMVDSHYVVVDIYELNSNILSPFIGPGDISIDESFCSSRGMQ
jgi:hypothetical protein